MPTRKIISFDLDGVIAEGPYIAPEDRNNKTFCKLATADPEVIPALQWLGIMYDIFIVSARNHEEANLGARAWLHWILGLELDTIAGVITGPSGMPEGATRVDKKLIVEALGSLVHFDDRPATVESMPGVGVLLISERPDSKEAAGVLPTVRSWQEIVKFLSTPGMVLHGSGGSSVTSPCVAAPEVPKIDPAVVKALADSMKDLQ